MAEAKLKKILLQGERAARRGDWQSSVNCFQQAVNIAPHDCSAVNGLASSLLQSGQPAEAIKYFVKVVALSPQSADAYNNLGVAQMIAGQYPRSEEAFRQALDVNPEHIQSWKNLALVYLKQNKMEEGVQILASLVKLYPKDIEVLYLLGQCYQEAEEFDSARYLYDEVLKTNPDFKLAKEALNSLPGMRVDPSRIARAEHASKLSVLKSLKQGVKKEPLDVRAPSKSEPKTNTGESKLMFDPQQPAAFVGLPALPGGRRVALMAKLLSQSGCRTRFVQAVEAAEMAQFDFFVFSQPHISPDLINGVMYCIQNSKRYAVDIDQDYHNLPEDHPAYTQFGKGNSNAVKALNVMLQEAAWVSVPSTILAQRMAQYAKRVSVIPSIWDWDNPLWEKPKPSHPQFNLGWLGTAADRVDLLSIKPALESCVNNNAQVQLVVAGDSAAYEMFDGISEGRRLYLPAANPEDIPYILSQFDVLLLPLRDNLYNQAKSDLPLLEAGVLHIPWIATPIHAFKEWNEGGILVEAGEWCEAIHCLVNDEKFRMELSGKGREKAEDRQNQLRNLR